MKEGQDTNVTQNPDEPAVSAAETAEPVIPKFRLFLEAHGVSWKAATNVLIGACVLACVGLAAAAVGWNRSARVNRENEASRLLLQAASSAGINELLNKYPACKVRPVALLRLAQFQQVEGNYTLAQDTYAQFMKEFPNYPLASTAELGKIVCVESAGNVDEAIRGYDDFIARRSNDVLAAEAVFGKGRCMERLGRLDEARQIYEDFLAAHPDSAWKTRADQALEFVTRELHKAGAEK